MNITAASRWVGLPFHSHFVSFLLLIGVLELKLFLIFSVSALLTFGLWSLVSAYLGRKRARSSASWSVGSGVAVADYDSRGWITVGYANACVRFFDRSLKLPLNGGDPLRIGPEGFGLVDLSVRSAGARRLLAVASGMREINVYDVTTPAAIRNKPLAAQMADTAITCLDLDPSGEKLVFGDAEGFVRLWEWKSESDPVIMKAEDTIGTVRHVAFGDGLIAAAGGDFVVLWDTVSRLHIGTIDHTGVASVRFFGDEGNRLAISGNGLTAFWDLTDSRNIGNVDHAGVSKAVFTPDNEVMATIAHDGLAFWRISTGEPCGVSFQSPGVVFARFIDHRTLLAVDSRGSVHEHRLTFAQQPAPALSLIRAGGDAGLVFGDTLPAEPRGPAVVTAVVRQRSSQQDLWLRLKRRYRAHAYSLLAGILVTAGWYSFSFIEPASPSPIPAPRIEPPKPKTLFYGHDPKPQLPQPTVAEAQKHRDIARVQERFKDQIGANRHWTVAGHLVSTLDKHATYWANTASGLMNDNPGVDATLSAGASRTSLYEGRKAASALKDPKQRQSLAKFELLSAEIYKAVDRSIDRQLAKARQEAQSAGTAPSVVNLRVAGLEGLGDALKNPDAVPLEEVLALDSEIEKRVGLAVKRLMTDLQGTRLPSRDGRPKPVQLILKVEFPEEYAAVRKAMTRARKSAVPKKVTTPKSRARTPRARKTRGRP